MTTQTTEGSTQQTSNNTQQQSNFDPQKLAETIATAAATKAAEAAKTQVDKVVKERMAEAARVLQGQPTQTEDKEKNLAITTLTNPSQVFGSVIKVAKEEAKKELREEMAAKAAKEDRTQKIAAPFLNEYPALNTPDRLSMVEGVVQRNLQSGQTADEALKNAFTSTVRELNLTPASKTPPTGMPSGGSVYFPNQNIDLNKSSTGFFEGARNRLAAARSGAKK